MSNKTDKTCVKCGKHGSNNHLQFCNGIFTFCKNCAIQCCDDLKIEPYRENGIIILDSMDTDMSEILYDIQHEVNI